MLLLLFSCQVMSDSLWPHGPEHVRPSCLLLPPRVGSNSYWLLRWQSPTISFSVVPFSSCTHSFPTSGYKKMLLFPKTITLKIEGHLLNRSKLRTWREQNSPYLASVNRLPSITRLSFLQSRALWNWCQLMLNKPTGTHLVGRGACRKCSDSTGTHDVWCSEFRGWILKDKFS